MSSFRDMWILFRATAPTDDGQTAQAMYEKRLTWITSQRQIGLVPLP